MAQNFFLIFASLKKEIRFSLRSNLICSTRHRSQHLQPDSFSSTMKQHRESFVVLSSYQSQQKICGLLYPINKVRLHPKAASCARCAKGKNGEEEMSRHKHGEDEQWVITEQRRSIRSEWTLLKLEAIAYLSKKSVKVQRNLICQFWLLARLWGIIQTTPQTIVVQNHEKLSNTNFRSKLF